MDFPGPQRLKENSLKAQAREWADSINPFQNEKVWNIFPLIPKQKRLELSKDVYYRL